MAKADRITEIKTAAAAAMTDDMKVTITLTDATENMVVNGNENGTPETYVHSLSLKTTSEALINAVMTAIESTGF